MGPHGPTHSGVIRSFTETMADAPQVNTQIPIPAPTKN
jgi:hypothetical protein